MGGISVVFRWRVYGAWVVVTVFGWVLGKWCELGWCWRDIGVAWGLASIEWCWLVAVFAELALSWRGMVLGCVQGLIA